MRPSHHANDRGTLFQNPWNEAETDAAPPSNSTATGRSWSLPLPLPALPTFPAIPSIPILERAKPRKSHSESPIKVVRPDWGVAPSVDSAARAVKATWLGHASFLLEFPHTSSNPNEDPPRVLFDPIFSDRAGPLPWTGVRRRLPPPCTIEELPPFQFVVYSHNHYDHLDLPTLQSIHARQGDNVHFIAPLGNKTWFVETGIPESQVSELDWWDTLILPTGPSSSQRLKFVCTPAQHSSGRAILDARTTLWASWVVEQTFPSPRIIDGLGLNDEMRHRVAAYFGGDSGYMTTNGPCPIFQEIGEKYGPFDISMLPIWRGGMLSFIAHMGFRLIETPESMLTALHATPAQALRMHGALRSRHTLAMHFATFAGSDIEAFDPIVDLERAKREMGRAIADGDGGKAEAVGDWWEDGGMGVIDIGETAVIICAGAESEISTRRR